MVAQFGTLVGLVAAETAFAGSELDVVVCEFLGALLVLAELGRANHCSTTTTGLLAAGSCRDVHLEVVVLVLAVVAAMNTAIVG